MNLATNSFTASSVVGKPISTHNYRYSRTYDHHPHKPFSLLLHHRTQLSKLTTTSRWKSTTSVRTAVAAVVNSSDPVEKEEASSNKYYFVVANAKFMPDEEEHFQEQLAERMRLYRERNLEQDFWLVIEPKFLDKFPNFTKRLKRPAVALVSTNGPWITQHLSKFNHSYSKLFS